MVQSLNRAIELVRSKYPASSLFLSVEEAIKADDTYIISQLITHNAFNTMWSFHIPSVSSSLMASIIGRRLSPGGRKALQDHISIIERIQSLICGEYTFSQVRQILTFDEIARAGRIHILDPFVQYTDSDLWNDVMEFIREGKSELYDLSEETIHWCTRNKFLVEIIDHICNDNPHNIHPGCMDKHETLVVYAVDAYNIFIHPKIGMYPLYSDDTDRFSTYPYIHGKILQAIVAGKVPHLGTPTVSDLIRSVTDAVSVPLIRRFKLLLSILQLDISKSDRYAALAIGVSQGWIDILDLLSGKDILPVMAVTERIHPSSVSFLQGRNLHPEWFIPYVNRGVKNIPTLKIWRKFLANIIVYKKDNFTPIISTLLEIHRGEITSSVANDILSFTEKHRDSSFLETMRSILSDYS